MTNENKELIDKIKSKLVKKDDTYTITISKKDYTFKILNTEEMLATYELAKATKIDEDMLMCIKSITNVSETDLMDLKESVMNVLLAAILVVYSLDEDTNTKELDNGNTELKYLDYVFELKELTAIEARRLEKDSNKYSKVLKSIVSPSITEDEFKKLPANVSMKLYTALRDISEAPDFF